MSTSRGIQTSWVVIKNEKFVSNTKYIQDSKNKKNDSQHMNKCTSKITEMINLGRKGPQGKQLPPPPNLVNPKMALVFDH